MLGARATLKSGDRFAGGKEGIKIIDGKGTRRIPLPKRVGPFRLFSTKMKMIKWILIQYISARFHHTKTASVFLL
jgi:hypothetical protein